MMIEDLSNHFGTLNQVVELYPDASHAKFRLFECHPVSNFMSARSSASAPKAKKVRPCSALSHNRTTVAIENMLNNNTVVTPPPPAYPVYRNLSKSIGALMIGVVVGAVIYGILVWQTAYYLKTYSKDTRSLKLLVSGLLFLETVSLCLESFALYNHLITNFGSAHAISKYSTPQLVIQVESVVVYTIMFVTQGYFALRIWRLSSQGLLLTITMVLVIFAAYATALVTAISFFSKGTVADSPLLQQFVPANKILETVADILITASLCFYLHESRTAIRRTDSIINRLIIFSVHRGAITTFLQLCYLISYEISTSTLAWTAFHVAISKVYSNTVVATLNHRRAVRDIGDRSLSRQTQPIHFSHGTTTQERVTHNSGTDAARSTIFDAA